MNQKKLEVTAAQALQHYGSEERLLSMINDMLNFYIRLQPIFCLLETCGLHPENMLDPTHPAYISDAIALRCLSSYDPQESDNTALERCWVEQWHQAMTHMEAADLSLVSQDGCDWEQYPLDSLLRLVWRLRQETVLLPFFLEKVNQTQLQDGFCFDIRNGSICLIQRTHQRCYEISIKDTQTFADFRSSAHKYFKLATEDYGYFVPSFVWLSHRAIKKEG